MTDEAEFASYETVADIIKSRDKLRDALTELVEIHKMIQHVNGGLPLLSRVEKAWQAASAALAQQAPTPAVLFESMSPAEQRAAGESLYAIWDASRSAKLTPATAEPAAPVDARDALDASRYRWLREQAQYVDTDNGAMSMTGDYFMSVSARNVGPWLPKSARYDFETLDAACDAAIAHQAAGEKP